MLNSRKTIQLLHLIFTIVQYAGGQRTDPDHLPCGSDNLSCPNLNLNIPECYSNTMLCDGTDFCSGGSDEGSGSTLDCKYT